MPQKQTPEKAAYLLRYRQRNRQRLRDNQRAYYAVNREEILKRLHAVRRAKRAAGKLSPKVKR